MTMNSLQRSAIIATLVKESRERNAFCGETFVQKSVYFLQELLQVPCGFEYQLYIYGPFSFELQGHLGSMRADDMLGITSFDYGTTFEPGEQYTFLESNLGRTIATYRKAVEFVVQHLAGWNVKQLERVATALYFTVTADESSRDQRVAMIREVKPHIGAEEAQVAIDEVDRWRTEIAEA
jgi:uncharacterized protein YwgA